MSKLFATTTALLFFTISFVSELNAQPANDNCSGAVTLTAGTPVSGTVWNATASSSIPTGCSVGNPDDDVWYRFTATSSGVATITLSAVGTELDASGAIIQLFSGSCGSLTSVACANGSLSELITNGLTNGNTYFLRVFAYATGALTGGSSGSAFTITFTTAVPPPSNDECVNSILLPTSNSCLNSKGWLQGATTSSGAPNCSPGPVKYDVWYHFVASSTSHIATISSLGSNINTSARLQLLSGSCGSLNSLDCGTTSVSSSSLTIGNTYYVRVSSNTSSSSTFTSNASFNVCVTDPLSPSVVDSTASLFNTAIVARNLGYPWELTYGPDDSLWITEARGYRVLRISSTRSAAQVNVPAQQVLRIPLGVGEINFGRDQEDIDPGGGVTGRWPQGGMQGLAIHPDFMTNSSKRWVYLSYVYKVVNCANSNTACDYRTKIVRCRFYFSADAGNPSLRIPKADTLTIMDTVISNLSGSNDHNSGRLKVGPTLEGPDNTYKLYYTIGDMGAGQFNNASRTNYAQNTDTAEGKVLRLNTEPDGDGVPGSPVHEYSKWRQWIPNNNPFNHSVFTSVKTPVYSFGHRNAQGLAWGNVNGTWRLYSSEHGDMSGDEVNIIQSGHNYGWPKVTGMADDNYNTYDDLNNGFTANNVLASQTINDESTFYGHTSNITRPMFEFFNWTAAQIQTTSGNIFTWPTIAPSSIDFYSGNIPGWKYSLLVPSLKYGLFRLKLNSTGSLVDSTASSPNTVDTFPLMHGWRVRDIAINPVPNSGQFWAITDSSGSTSGPTGGFAGGNQSTQDAGRVLRLTYKTAITLPVSFESFTGKLLPDRTIRLDWKAETDQNHSYFEVEKSTDNSSFTPIGRVWGGPPYYYIDPSPNVGNNYYRIREEEFNKAPSYSKVINVVYDPSAYIVAMYPNPMKDVLNIRIAAPRPGKIQIEGIDMQGRVLYRQNQLVSVGTKEIQIDVRKWAPQLYTIKVTGEKNNTLSIQKIMRQ